MVSTAKTYAKHAEINGFMLPDEINFGAIQIALGLASSLAHGI